LNPFFSIVIPCYNQSHYLPDCIESLLKQSHIYWEALIVNDGSTDATSEVARLYASKDSRIKLIEKENGGLSSARNEGIQNAIGSYLLFLDSDDFLYEECLSEIAKVAPLVDYKTVLQYGYTYITENKETVLHTVLPRGGKELIPAIFSSVLGPCHTICISKLLCESIGLFDESLKSLEDWDFWIRTAKVGGTKMTIDKPLVYYRYVKNSMSRNAFIMYESFKKVAQRAPKKDDRILVDSSENKDYDFDSNLILNEALLRFLGVSIMQGNIEQSISLFQQESYKEITDYNPEEFGQMCSYLSFRYWYSKPDIDSVFSEIYPNFKQFFQLIGYQKSSINSVLFHVFKRHYFYRNIYKYGKGLGSIINFSLRLRYK
jgi:glycosyltransferase involved in cell wall biosynthesis